MIHTHTHTDQDNPGRPVPEGQTILDFESSDNGVEVASAGPYASHLYLVQTDNHASTSSLKFFMGRLLFLSPNQQRQSNKGDSD